MSRGYISDMRHARAHGMYSPAELVCWMLISFVLGASGAVTLLILLGVQ